MKYIYFDQAASSFPKPKAVIEAVMEALAEYGANPGRSGHQLAKKAGDIIAEARWKLSEFFGAKQPNHVIFFPNATYALNQAIFGLPLEKGDHVISTSLEHNSVRRPLERLKKTLGIEVTYAQPNSGGIVTEAEIEKHIKKETKAIIMTHGSNVTGAIMPIERIGGIAEKHGLFFIVDASQTAGVLPIDMEKMKIDALAFPGHKSMLGPQGTGVLIMKDPALFTPLIYGGTGGFSHLVDQPEKCPERFESGTLNTPGIAGLLAAVKEIEKIGLDKIFAHEWKLTSFFLSELGKLDAVTVYGPPMHIERLPVVSFSLKGLDAHEAAAIFDEHYHIALRAGLHCAPLAHETYETGKTGALRASFGYYNMMEEIKRFVQAIQEVVSYFS